MQSLRVRGFTLVELMVVVAVVAILVVVAAPNVSDWLQNARTRSIAESVQNGLRYAQTQAASLSRQTTFVSTATSWTVDYIALPSDADATAPPSHPLQTSPAGMFQGTVITLGGAAPATLVFNSLGRAGTTAAGVFTGLGADATFDVTNPSGSRILRIVLTPGGKTRMCDRDKVFNLTTTPDGC